MSHSIHNLSSSRRAEIPKVQKAAIVQRSSADVEVRSNVPVKQPEELSPGECLIRMHCTGVCHTDLHAALGDWPIPTKDPLIGGHEGVGEIVAIGNDTTDSPVKIGDRVGVKWIAYSYVRSFVFETQLSVSAFSCLECEQCRNSHEQSKWLMLPYSCNI
jgi:propanol-preferring alcohol dehydrogenase